MLRQLLCSILVFSISFHTLSDEQTVKTQILRIKTMLIKIANDDSQSDEDYIDFINKEIEKVKMLEPPYNENFTLEDLNEVNNFLIKMKKVYESDLNNNGDSLGFIDKIWNFLINASPYLLAGIGTIGALYFGYYYLQEDEDNTPQSPNSEPERPHTPAPETTKPPERPKPTPTLPQITKPKPKFEFKKSPIELRDKPRTRFENPYPIFSLALSPDGNFLVSGTSSGTIRVRKTANWKVFTLAGADLSSRVYRSIAWGAGDNIVAVSHTRDYIEVWDALSNERRLGTFETDAGNLAVSVSSDGRFLVSGSADHTVTIWKYHDWNHDHARIKTLKGHSKEVMDIRFAPNNRHFASGSNDGTIRIWHAYNERCVGILKGHTGPVQSVVFSPDGKYIASASNDKTIKVWKWKNWISNTGNTQPQTFIGHTNTVVSVAWSPDSKYILSGSDDKTIKIWDVTANKLIVGQVAHEGAVNAVLWTPDGNKVITGSGDASIKVWTLIKNQ